MKLKIGIICPYNIYRFGGVQEAVLAHAKHLRLHGHKVLVIAPAPKHVPTKLHEDTITLGRAILYKTPFKTSSDFSYKADKNEIEKLLKKYKFDILHFHEPWVPLLPKQILLAARKKGIKTVATFHAKLPDGISAKAISTIMRPYAKPIVPKIDALIAVSEAASKNIKTYTKREIKIIPNAIEQDIYNPDSVENHELTDVDVPTVFYVGRLETRKGVEYLIKAVAKINEMGKIRPRLIIAGDGPLRDKLVNLAYSLGIYDVHFLGFVSLEDKLKLLKSSDVFCSPALYGESFGIVLIEAMAMGTAVVAGNNDGYSGVLSGDASVGLVDTKNVDNFAKILQKVLTNNNLREKLEAWGLANSKKYHYDEIVKCYENIYRELLKS